MYTQKDLVSEYPYVLFKNRSPFLRQYDQEFYDLTDFGERAETKSFFKPSQIQEAVAYAYSDTSWDISELGKRELQRDLVKALDPRQDPKDGFELSLDIKTTFKRRLPRDAPLASVTQSKRVDLSRKYDCETG